MNFPKPQTVNFSHPVRTGKGVLTIGVVAVIFLALALSACSAGSPPSSVAATPASSSSSDVTPQTSPVAVAQTSPTATPTSSPTASSTPTLSPTPTPKPSPTSTNTPTPEPSPTPTQHEIIARQLNVREDLTDEQIEEAIQNTLNIINGKRLRTPKAEDYYKNMTQEQIDMLNWFNKNHPGLKALFTNYDGNVEDLSNPEKMAEFVRKSMIIEPGDIVNDLIGEPVSYVIAWNGKRVPVYYTGIYEGMVDHNGKFYALIRHPISNELLAFRINFSKGSNPSQLRRKLILLDENKVISDETMRGLSFLLQNYIRNKQIPDHIEQGDVGTLAIAIDIKTGEPFLMPDDPSLALNYLIDYEAVQ